MLNCLLVASSKTVGGFEYFFNLPNGGLTSIAGNVDKTKCNVKVLDLVSVRFKAKTFFTDYITKNRFDIIGFSCMVFQFHEMLELAKIAKANNPKVLTVVGGYYATVCSDELLNSEDIKYFDFIIRGEGEIAFKKLVDEISDGYDLSKVPGLSYKLDGKIFNNPCDDLIDLSTLKLPDRDSRVFKNSFYIFDYLADVVETSRGCTYTCNFCSITKMYGRSFRPYNIERIMKDIQDARDKGARVIFFTDDNITLNVKHFEELCNRIIETGLNKMKFIIQASVKGFMDNPHLPELIRKAGFEWVFLGIESNSDESLQFLKKNNQLKSSDIEIVVKSLQKENIFVFGGMILGNPSDTKESIQATYQFAKRIGIDLPVLLALTPFPGTVLREELLKNNYITNLNDYSKYDTYHVNVRTDHLSSFELFEVIDSIIQKYYIDSGAIYRVIKRYPKFFIKSFFKFVFYHPDMVFHHLTQGRFLKKNKREKEFGMNL